MNARKLSTDIHTDLVIFPYHRFIKEKLHANFFAQIILLVPYRVVEFDAAHL